MGDTPSIVFMNQNFGVLDWFYSGPTRRRAEEHGGEIRGAETR